MKTKTHVKAGVLTSNHNQRSLRACGLRVQTGIKAGGKEITRTRCRSKGSGLGNEKLLLHDMVVGAFSTERERRFSARGYISRVNGGAGAVAASTAATITAVVFIGFQRPSFVVHRTMGFEVKGKVIVKNIGKVLLIRIWTN